MLVIDRRRQAPASSAGGAPAPAMAATAAAAKSLGEEDHPLALAKPKRHACALSLSRSRVPAVIGKRRDGGATAVSATVLASVPAARREETRLGRRPSRVLAVKHPPLPQ